MTAPSVSTCAPWAASTHAVIDQSISFQGTILDDCLQYASDVLFGWTGRRWPGACSETVRPVGDGGRGYGPGIYGRSLGTVHGLGSQWFASGVGRTLALGVDRWLSEVRLPGYPIVSIGEVVIDGAVVAPARYRVDNHKTLVYIPESTSATRQGWPGSQDMTLASDSTDGVADTWEVTYTYGTLPDVGGQYAAARLGFELALAFDPGADPSRCKLPARVTTLSARGQTLAMIDPLDLFAEGLTGLSEVDLWVASKRAEMAQPHAQVFVPGQRASARRAGT